MKSFLIGIICLFFLNLDIQGQSPYEVNFEKEIPYYSVGISAFVVGKYLSNRAPFFTTDELVTLDPNDINRFDRIATSRFSENSNTASDVLVYISHGAPYLFLAGKDSRKHFLHVITMYGEAASINAGFTTITKSLFKRPRPYVFNDEITEEYKLSKKAKTSFVSGHTSTAAVNCFFVAKVYSDFYPDSKWKPVVWTLAATIPAATGVLRITAGKHYPTDVIAGYAMGATIGFLIPHFHRNKKLEDLGLKINMGYNSALLTWNFNHRVKEKAVIGF